LCIFSATDAKPPSVSVATSLPQSQTKNVCVILYSSRKVTGVGGQRAYCIPLLSYAARCNSS